MSRCPTSTERLRAGRRAWYNAGGGGPVHDRTQQILELLGNANVFNIAELVRMLDYTNDTEVEGAAVAAERRGEFAVATIRAVKGAVLALNAAERRGAGPQPEVSDEPRPKPARRKWR